MNIRPDVKTDFGSEIITFNLLSFDEKTLLVSFFYKQTFMNYVLTSYINIYLKTYVMGISISLSFGSKFWIFDNLWPPK